MTPSGHAQPLDSPHIVQHGPLSASRANSGACAIASNELAMRRARDSAVGSVPGSVSSRNTSSSSSSLDVESRTIQRDVRTLPPWIGSHDEVEESCYVKATTRLLSPPSKAYPAQHHYNATDAERRISQDGFIDTYDEAVGVATERRPETYFFGGPKEPVKGRKWDHARDHEPIIMQSGVPENASPWRIYMKSSTYGPALDEEGKRVDLDFLQKQTPGYQRPWRGDLGGASDPENLSGFLHSRRQQKIIIRRLQHNLLMHPLVPLLFRLVVFTTSVIAIGISTSVHHLSNKYFVPQNPSSTMAVVVDVVAIPYILYITWDEYTGKPLGLRSAKAKIRLVLLDLWFIIFESANLSLAFGALTDNNGGCKNTGWGPSNEVICSRVRALCGILMVALIAWSLTFAISIFRLVERVGGREDGD